MPLDTTEQSGPISGPAIRAVMLTSEARFPYPALLNSYQAIKSEFFAAMAAGLLLLVSSAPTDAQPLPQTVATAVMHAALAPACSHLPILCRALVPPRDASPPSSDTDVNLGAQHAASLLHYPAGLESAYWAAETTRAARVALLLGNGEARPCHALVEFADGVRYVLDKDSSEGGAHAESLAGPLLWWDVTRVHRIAAASDCYMLVLDVDRSMVV